MKISAITGLKACSKCGRTQGPEMYYKDRSTSDGLNCQCKACRLRNKRKYINRADRFWKTLAKKTTYENGCRIWHGRTKKGLPMYWYDNKNVSVRRVVYQLARGELPDDVFILMICKNRACVNLYHMQPGTKEDREVLRVNSAATGDRHGSRPHPERRPRGERQRLAKLTAEDVYEIRASAESNHALARHHGVDETTISRVRTGKTWKHVVLPADPTSSQNSPEIDHIS